MEEIKRNHLETDVAVLKVELAGVKSQVTVQGSELDLLRSERNVGLGVKKSILWIIGTGVGVAIALTTFIIMVVQL